MIPSAGAMCFFEVDELSAESAEAIGSAQRVYQLFCDLSDSSAFSALGF
jgi:hypothetical protein